MAIKRGFWRNFALFAYDQPEWKHFWHAYSAQTICVANFSFSNYDIKSSKPIKWHDCKISGISQGTPKLSDLESSLEQKIQ